MLADKCRTTASLATISRSVQGLNLPRKRLIARERDEKAWKKFRLLTTAFDRDQFLFIDELGSNLGLTRRYGRAEPGKRVLDQVPGERGGTVSTLGALGLDGICTGVSVPGAIEGDTLLFFGEELLVPTLKRDDRVFMDNTPSHKRDDLEDALEGVGAWGLFLPTYSPELNPSETCGSKVHSPASALSSRAPCRLYSRR